MTCRDRLAAANQTIADQAATITNLNTAMAAKDGQIVAQQEQITALKGELADCQAGLGSGDYAAGYNAGLSVAWAK